MARIPGAIIPVDPTIPPDDQPYRYSVVVVATCGDTSHETLVVLHEPDVLTHDEAEDIAIHAAVTEAGLSGATSPLPSGIVSAQCIYTARVVSVGRRSDVPAIRERG